MSENQIVRSRRISRGLSRAARGVGVAFRAARGVFPLTWLSLVILVGLYYTWYWEVTEHANQILYAVVLVMLGVVGLMLGMVVVGTALVGLVTWRVNRRALPEGVMEVGAGFESGWRVYRPFYLPFVSAGISLGEGAPFLQRFVYRGQWGRETLIPTSRGRYAQVVRWVEVSDIFGLSSIRFRLREAVAYEIKPASSGVSGLAFQARATGEGYSHPEGEAKGELVEMRRYQAGDPLRLVLWKVFARSRKLLVRAPEPAIVEQNDMFVYFVSGEEDESSASTARAFLSTFGEDEGEMLFSADGSGRVVKDGREGLSDVIDSVHFRSRHGADLLTVAPLIEASVLRNCFMMVPSRLGPWFEGVRAFCGRYGVRPIFVVSVSGDVYRDSVVRRSFWRRLFFGDEAVEGRASAHQALCEALGKLGEVRVVDVSSGAMMPYSAPTQGRAA